MMKMFSDFCEKHRLISENDHILCAVSGGADSMAMLDILHKMSETYYINISVAHLNHGIRGEEADRDERFVQEFCEKLGIILRSEKVNVPEYAKLNSLGIEESARILRYDFLQKTANELTCNKIATAHNARDNAETVLMNLCRGSGLRGLCGISPVRGNIIRPILCFDRHEIEEYLEINGISFQTDTTNFDTKYSRNCIRYGAIKELEAYNEKFASKFLSATELLREDEIFLNSLAEKYLSENAEISASNLTKQPYSIASRVIMMKAPNISRLQVDQVLQLANSNSAHMSVDVVGMRISKVYDKLYFGYISANSLGDVEISVNEPLIWGIFEINCQACVLDYEKIQNKQNLCFKSEKICGKIMVTGRKSGDSMRIPQRKITKSLKKLFSEASIEPNKRNLLPVIRDEKGVVAVLGFGVDERVEAKIGDYVTIINIKPLSEEENTDA